MVDILVVIWNAKSQKRSDIIVANGFQQIYGHQAVIWSEKSQKKEIYYMGQPDPQSVQNPKCFILMGSLHIVCTNIHLRIRNKVIIGQWKAPEHILPKKWQNDREQKW